MKKIKSLLCIMLLVLLLASVGAVAVSAEKPVEPDMEALHQSFIAYLDEQGVEHCDESNNELSSVDFIAISNDWCIFKGIVWPITDMPVKDNIGRYVFYSMGGYRPYEIGVYAEKDKEILKLDIAYYEGKIDIDEIARIIMNNEQDHLDLGIRLIGDTNADNKITVVDVINIQKLIAKKIFRFEDAFADPDYNQDKEIDIKDVLDMQKRIAKITN